MSGGSSILMFLIGLAGVAFSVYAGFLIANYILKRRLALNKQKSQQMLEEAKQEAEKIRKDAQLEAKDLLYRLRIDFEKETKDRRQELSNMEKRMLSKEENIDRRVELLERKEKEVESKQNAVHSLENNLRVKEQHLDGLVKEEKERLQRISSLTPQQARELLLSRLEQELSNEKAVLLKNMEDQIKENAAKKAQEIVALAIQRSCVEHTTESTVSVVALPNDEMKGRIIGREGRNIRAFEMATGIDVIIDDTPEAVILSGFDVVRREVARVALEKLISDGRIHPGRIEEIVEKAKKDMEINIREEGEKAAFDIGIHGLHPELIKLLGRLKYRTSFGQNALQHSKEVAYLMGVMASELGADFKLSRRIGLLHDIGKAVDQDVEGTHAKIGAELAKKFGESNEVVNAIAAHHEEIELNSFYSVLSAAADAISAARPGARRETLETYVKRLDKLESIANVFPGVEKAFAIQAGREVRIIVQPEKITDAEAVNLARDVRKKIEEGMEYPGQIKVTVIRETRAIEIAK
ncbi:MAG: ribonuclease Y [Candidatus Omnitrophota bacterium]